MSTQFSQSDSGPVRVAVTHVVDLKKQKAFEIKLKEEMEIASHYQGFLGTEIVKRAHEQQCEYNVFYRFDNLEHYSQWNDSKRKLGLIEQLHQFTVSSKKTFLTGLETWFTLGSDQPIIPPPKYKMAFSSWVCIYLLLILMFSLFGTPLRSLPMPLRFFVVSLTIVLLMTYVVMPLLTRILARWLYPKK